MSTWCPICHELELPSARCCLAVKCTQIVPGQLNSSQLTSRHNCNDITSAILFYTIPSRIFLHASPAQLRGVLYPSLTYTGQIPLHEMRNRRSSLLFKCGFHIDLLEVILQRCDVRFVRCSQNLSVAEPN